MEAAEPTLDLAPDPTVLQLLRDVTRRYGIATAARLRPSTESERHFLATGHALGFGCCRRLPEPGACAADIPANGAAA